MRKIFILCLALISFNCTYATHMLGGEITWKCIKDSLSPDFGKYIFQMKVYGDCSGNEYLLEVDMNLVIWDHPNYVAPNNTVLLVYDPILSQDISPVCNPAFSTLQLDCASSDPNSVKEFIYESGPVSLPGVPPPTGWHFSWNQCCRPGAVANLLNPSSLGFTLRASMFPWIDPATGVARPAEPCFDASPIFNESPNTIICTGYPFAYSHNASDPELDSISYEWDQPLDDGFGATWNPGVNPPFVPFTGVSPLSGPYAFNNPIPGGVNLDAVTGEISYNSSVSGSFATCVSVKSYKCGQLVAEVFRDIPAVLINCATAVGGIQNNAPPTVSPPNPILGSQTWTTIFNPNTGLPSYETTINQGDLVQFDINAIDPDFYIDPNGGQVPQEITLEISGGQITKDPIGCMDTICDNPPCATFVDANGICATNGIVGFNSVSGVFSWQTDCNQLNSDAGCGTTTNVFTFLIKAKDDFCPANGVTIATIKITILPAIAQPAPNFRCVTRNGTGDLLFNWVHDTSFTHTSTSYQILGAPSLGGPYIQIADVAFPADSFLINESNLPINGLNYFYMRLSSQCIALSLPSDTMIPVSYSRNYNNVSCYMGNDGRIAINMLSNLTTPFYYYLDGVLNTNPVDSVFDDLSSGTYTLAITDNMSCYIEEEIIITAPQSPLQVMTIDSVTLCHQDSLGQLIAIGAGGTPTYSYEWFNSTVGPNNQVLSTNDTISNLPSGIYYVRLIDANGCDTSISAQIISPQTALFSTHEVSPVICKGDSSGYIVGDAGGGYPPYIYTWSTSLGGVFDQSIAVSNTDTVFNLPSGIYLLDIVDQRGCTSTQSSIIINEPLSPLSIDTLMLVDSIDCYGDNSGKAIAYVSGGTTPLTYLWDNGEINTLAHYLTGGYRTFSLTDNRGCEVVDSIFIPESSEIISTLVVDSAVNCYGDTNAIVSVSTIGGYAQYTYTWSHTPSVTSTGLVDTAFNLSYGSYAVTTEDSLGCYVTDSIYLPEPNLLTVQAIELSWISCKDSADGVAEVLVQGGTMPYHYSWDGSSYITNSIINTLGPGSHIVDVMDAKGCMASTSVFINEPPQLVVTITDNLSVYCDGMSTGSLTSQASGGTPGYTYLWDDNQNLPQTTAQAVNLEVGLYTVTVTDSRGCIAHVQETVILDPSMQLDTTLSHVSCYGLADGSASVSAVGGHAPYSYYWTGPNYSNTASSIDHLLAGTYTITVVDTNNCVRVSSVDIVEPLPITYNIVGSTVNEHCDGYCDGRIYIDSLLGGTTPYHAILYDNVTGDTLLPLSIVGDTIMGVCNGDYTVVITDSEGCTSSLIPAGNDHVVVSATYDAPTPLILPPSVITCYGDNTGMLELDPNTYDPNYIYTWSNGSTGTSINNLTAGSYFVTAQYQIIGGLSPVIYNGGAIDSLIGTGGYFNGNRHLELSCTNPVRLVSAVVYAGSVETITFELRDNNGSVLEDTTITVQVGEQRLYFDFDIPVGTDLELGVASNGSNLFRNNSGAIFPYNIGSFVSITGTNANPSDYYYFFYDIEIEEPGSSVVSECSDTSQHTVLLQENQIIATSQVDSVDCYGNSTGSISHIISGGVSPYTHSWSNGATTSSITNLTAGTYTDNVLDANGCEVMFTDVVEEPDELTVSIYKSSSNCYVLESDVVGGTSPYVYKWKLNNSVVGAGAEYDVINYGTYSLTVIDANGCTSTSSNITYVESWNCVNDACVDPCDGSGTYSTLSQCEESCGAPTDIIDENNTSISIFPNPFHQSTTVDFGKVVKYGELKLFDVLGKLIEEHELIDVENFVIERKDKIDGVYFIEIEIENEKWFNKIILE